MTEQPGDDAGAGVFLPGRPRPASAQVPCWITHTNERTHEIIRGGLDRSPMFTGVIEGDRSALLSVDRGQGHAIRRQDVAPDLSRAGRARRRSEIYPNGISTSLPFDMQIALVHSIRGLEQARISASRLRDRIRLLRSARPQELAGNQGDSRDCFSPDRSTARPATKRPPRRDCWRASMPRCRSRWREPLVLRAATRPISACWWTI